MSDPPYPACATRLDSNTCIFNTSTSGGTQYCAWDSTRAENLKCYVPNTDTASDLELIRLIEQSQERETSYLKTLYENSANVLARTSKDKLSDSDRFALYDKIDQESTYRTFLYTKFDIETASITTQKNLNAELRKERLKIIQLTELRLNEDKALLNSQTEIEQNQLKMVEINTYYGKQYQNYGKIGMVVCGMIVLLLLSVPLRPVAPTVASYWSSAVTLLGSLYLLYIIGDMGTRTNMDADEYTWGYAPTTKEELLKPKSIIDVKGLGFDIPSVCAGQYCCGPGTKWDDDLGCVLGDAQDIDGRSSAINS